ncbi:hypothetical protein Tco_1109643 [Tanacetum coccineum]
MVLNLLKSSLTQSFDHHLAFFQIIHSFVKRRLDTNLTLLQVGIPLFSVLKPCLACSRVFVGDIYGDHVVSCVGIIGIKHRHNVVHDTLVDICYRSGISAGKEVDIGLDGGRDKPLRPADMLLYSWDGGLDVWELEVDAVTLLKRIRKFSMAQDIGAHPAVHIFNRISFAIAKGDHTSDWLSGKLSKRKYLHSIRLGIDGTIP